MTPQDQIKLLQERIRLTQEYYLTWIWDEYCSETQFELGKQVTNLAPESTEMTVYKPWILSTRLQAIKNRIHQIDHKLFGYCKLQEL